MRPVYSKDFHRLLGTVEDGLFITKQQTFDRDLLTRLRDMRVKALNIRGTALSLTEAVKHGKIVDGSLVFTFDHEKVDTAGAER
jgi:hypothetical protein